MFEKLKSFGKAYADNMKTALDPERLRQEMEKAENLKYAMPNASPERLPELMGLVPGPPVDAETAREQRRQIVTPYLAPSITAATGPPPTIDRVFTRRPSADEIVSILSRTGLDGRTVLGVYPSSDLLHPAQFGQGDIWWEWCVVHTGGPAASEDLAAAAAVDPTERPTGPIVQCTEMARGERWIDRDRNDPILFDEEAAAIVAVQSGVDPAQCLGLHRMLDWGCFGVDPNRMVGVMPIGARILRRPFVTALPSASASGSGAPGDATASRLSAGAQEWMARQAAGRAVSADAPDPAAPLGTEAVGYAYGDPLPVQMDLLDWTTIALAVQPVWTTPQQAVTTHPHLPGSAEELLLQYLLILGLDPADTFGVATTVFEQQSAFLMPGAATAERGSCASMLAIVYRDRPAYAEGRSRFEQYRAEHLRVPLGIDRPVVGRAMKLAMAGMKWHVRTSVGDADLYDEIGGDDSVDGDLYPYIVGPSPEQR
jgi:hypothetical protein